MRKEKRIVDGKEVEVEVPATVDDAIEAIVGLQKTVDDLNTKFSVFADKPPDIKPNVKKSILDLLLGD